MIENPLLDAVDRLTKPRTSKVLQENEAGIRCWSDVEHDPLLAQLREAVVGGIGSHDGSASGSERLPFDANALKLYTDIEDTVAEWFVGLLQQPIHLLPEENLRRWYVAFENQRRAGNVGEQTERDMITAVERWARQVETKFDPPRRLELTVSIREPVLKVKTRRRVNKQTGESFTEPVSGPDGLVILVPKLDSSKKPVMRTVKRLPATCPVCEQRFAFDPETGDKMFALILDYRDEGQQTMENAEALCRSCEKVWKGGAGVRELSWAIEQEEDRLNTPA